MTSSTRSESLSDLPAQIGAAAERLYTDERLSHREVIDRLTSLGYDRTLCIEVVQQKARYRQLDTSMTAPLIFFAVTLALFLWSWFTPTADPSSRLGTLKGLVQAVTGMAIVPFTVAVIYKTYHLLPFVAGGTTGSLFSSSGRTTPQVVAIESDYLASRLDDNAAEAQLIAVLGAERGRQRFLLLRNQRHFGIQ